MGKELEDQGVKGGMRSARTFMNGHDILSKSETTMQHIKAQTAWDRAMSFSGLTIIDFYMSYCPPCQKLKPILEQLDKEYSEKGAPVKMFKIEIDDLPAMSRRFKVAAVPAIFFFVNGEESGSRLVGYKEKDVIVERIEKELAKVKK